MNSLSFLMSLVELKCRYLNGVERGLADVYWTEEDTRDIESWEEEERERAVKNILAAFDLTDMSVCPFCVRYIDFNTEVFDSGCANCTYGKRHGVCVDDKKASYDLIIDKLSLHNIDSIVAIPGLRREIERLCYT